MVELSGKEKVMTHWNKKDVWETRHQILRGDISQVFTVERLPVFLGCVHAKSHKNHSTMIFYRDLLSLSFVVPHVRLNRLIRLRNSDIKFYPSCSPSRVVIRLDSLKFEILVDDPMSKVFSYLGGNQSALNWLLTNRCWGPDSYVFAWLLREHHFKEANIRRSIRFWLTKSLEHYNECMIWAQAEEIEKENSLNH